MVLFTGKGKMYSGKLQMFLCPILHVHIEILSLLSFLQPISVTVEQVQFCSSRQATCNVSRSRVVKHGRKREIDVKFCN